MENRQNKNSKPNNFQKRDTKRTPKPAFNNRSIRTKKLNIDELDNELHGVARTKEKVYHVKNVLPGERVEVELPHLKDKSRESEYIYTTTRIITESPDRIKPNCPYFEQCGNCNILHCNYDAQLKIKKEKLDSTLKNADITANNFVTGNQFGYRNKVHLAFTEVDGKALTGFFNEETHRVIPVRRCLLHGKWYEKLVEILNKWATDNRLSAFKPWFGEGVLRFAVARHFDNNIMVTVVARENIRCMDELYQMLDREFEEVSLYLNINTQENSKVFSDRFIFIDGEKKLNGNILGIDFNLSPNSFFQVNTEIAGKIYETVLDRISKMNVNAVVDAYSGIGITSLLFASRGFDVISVEIVPKAVDDAKELARLNKLDGKIKFICGDCANILPKLDVPENTAFFVDPPRKGLGVNVCRSIIKFKPEHVVYLSCNPETLVEDVKRLKEGGYTVEEVTPFDMFGNTKHCESLCILRKAK